MTTAATPSSAARIRHPWRMMFLKYLLRLVVWIVLIPWWIYLGWSLANETFHWRYLAAAILPIIFWAVYRSVHEQNEAAIDKEERLRRFRQQRDHYGRRHGAQSRNRWKEHRWEAAHPEARKPDE